MLKSMGKKHKRRFIVLRDCECASVFTFDDIRSLDTAFKHPPSIVSSQLKSCRCLECRVQRVQQSHTRRERTKKSSKLGLSFRPQARKYLTKVWSVLQVVCFMINLHSFDWHCTNTCKGKGVCLRGFTFSNLPKSLIHISWDDCFLQNKSKNKAHSAQGSCKAGDTLRTWC